MNRSWPVLTVAGVLVAGLAFHLAAQSSPPPEAPRFTAAGQLQRPANYREWIWLSSGLGMSYNPSARSAGNPSFDNVFDEVMKDPQLLHSATERKLEIGPLAGVELQKIVERHIATESDTIAAAKRAVGLK